MLRVLKLLEETVAVAPNDAMARDMLACVLYDRGHFDRAASLWSQARTLQPECALYARNLAVALFSHLNRQAEALELLKQAIALDPERDQYKLEYLYAADKAGASAKERLAVIAVFPWQGRLRDDYTLERAKTHCLAGDYNGARSVMLHHEFVPAEGGEIAITNLYFSIRLRQARGLMKQGRAEEALDMLLALTEKLPENLHAGLWTETDLVPIHYYIAEALAMLDRRDESATRYALTLKRLNPDMPGLTFYYVRAMRALGRCEEAQIFLSRAVRSLEERAARRSIGWEDSTSSFNSYVIDQQAQREGLLAYWNGMLRLCDGDEAGAIDCFETSKRLWPENLNTWIELDMLRDK